MTQAKLKQVKLFYLLLIILWFTCWLYWLVNSNLPLTHDQLQKDAQFYMRVAKNLYSKGIIGGGTQKTAWIIPAYPIFLNLVFRLAGSFSPLPIRIAQLGLVGLNLVLVKQISKLYFSKKVTTTIILLTLLYIPFSWNSSLILTKGIFATLLLIWWWLWERIIISKKQSPWHLFLAGLTFAITLYAKPILFLWPIFLITSLILAKKKHLIKSIIITTIIGICLMFPWWRRNYKIFNHFIPFSLQGGEVLLGGTYQNYDFDPKTWPGGQNEYQVDQARRKLALKRISDQFKNNPVKLLS